MPRRLRRPGHAPCVRQVIGDSERGDVLSAAGFPGGPPSRLRRRPGGRGARRAPRRWPRSATRNPLVHANSVARRTAVTSGYMAAPAFQASGEEPAERPDA